jgi:uncharacterized protein (DUF983 family)
MFKLIIGWIRFMTDRCPECGTKYEFLPGFWGSCAVCPNCNKQIIEK